MLFRVGVYPAGPDLRCVWRIGGAGSPCHKEGHVGSHAQQQQTRRRPEPPCVTPATPRFFLCKFDAALRTERSWCRRCMFGAPLHRVRSLRDKAVVALAAVRFALDLGPAKDAPEDQQVNQQRSAQKPAQELGPSGHAGRPQVHPRAVHQAISNAPRPARTRPTRCTLRLGMRRDEKAEASALPVLHDHSRVD